MTVASADISARILGTPDIPVSVRAEGEIVLDVERAPHVQASGISLAVSDPALLDDLDPRDSRRIVIECAGRSFDLGIRDVAPDRAGGTARLVLASDEALLDDFSQLHDDLTPWDHQTSVRAVCDYVLGKIGAALEPGATDADVTAFWEVTNLVPFPTGDSGILGWSTSTGATNLTAVVPPVAPPVGSKAVRWRVGNGASIVQVGGWNGVAADKVCAVSPGREYTASIYLLSSTARNATIRLAFRDENGKTLNTVYSSTAKMTSTTTWRRFHVTGVVPPLARYAYIIVDTQGNTDGQLHYGQCVMLTEGAFLPAPFTGSTATSSHYEFEWAEAAHASPSTRRPILVERAPDALVWRAGVSGLEFLRPLLLSAGLRLVCDEQRRWTVRSMEYRAAGQQMFRSGVNIIRVDEKLARDDERWFDACVVRYTWTDHAGIRQERLDTFALTASPTKVLLREVDAPYPGPGRAQYAVTRAQGTGRTVTATKQATWTENAEQPFSAVLEGTPIQAGLAERVRFDLATNEVTTTSRTTDTPAGAIDLLAGTINALTGTINNL